MFGSAKKQPLIHSTRLSSLVAQGVEITGDLTFSSGIRIDGRVCGHLVGRAVDGTPSALLVLSQTGAIEGSVRCGDAVINGTVNGDLEIENFLELQSSAVVSGTIRYRQLKMDVGATVQGRLLRIPAAEAADNVVELEPDKPALVEGRGSR